MALETMDSMFANAKEKQQELVRQLQCQETVYGLYLISTFRDCRVHFLQQPFSTCESSLLNIHLLNRTFPSFRFPS